MVIGLLTLTAIPTVTGCAMGVSEQRKANERKNDARRMAKFHIDVECRDGAQTEEDDEVQGRRLVLRADQKVYLSDPTVPSHTATTFYIEYPELEETKHLKRGLGLVTSISDNPPMLGWIYVNKDTHELKFGNRTDSVMQIPAPWDWTDEERTVTLEDKKSFFAVEEDGGGWALYFDRDGDELERVLEEQGKLENRFAPVVFRRRLIEVPSA